MQEVDKKYSERNLRNMRKFYLIFRNDKKWNALRSNLSWTHFRTLLKLQNYNEIDYYMKISTLYNLSYRQLSEKIKNDEYSRASINQKEDFNNNLSLKDYIKDSIVIKNSNDYRNIDENTIKFLILEDLSSFLKELGPGFSFVDSEYRIRVGDTYNYIDLLLYNIKFHCYVVVELKATKLKKDHLGQIDFYMNYIDKHIKSELDYDTVGVIICKESNKLLIKYCSNPNIFSVSYLFY